MEMYQQCSNGVCEWAARRVGQIKELRADMERAQKKREQTTSFSSSFVWVLYQAAAPCIFIIGC